MHIMFTPGQKLYGERYQIIKEIGRGGFGITYLAEDKKGQQVVIKTLNETAQQSSDTEKLKVDFQGEALKLASCRHPYVVKYENFFNEYDLPCLVMEYIMGENLWETIEKQGVLEEMQALMYIGQIGSALNEAHSKGLLHRDVKPNNIIRRNKCEAVLIDFGLSKDFIPNQTPSKQEPLTHGFAAIEQYVQGVQLGEFTDVYALAATLYFLLTGVIPTSSFSRTLGNTLKEPIEINTKIHPVINEAILKGMTLYPDDISRPKSIQDWIKLFDIFIPSVDSDSPTWRISGIKSFSEIKVQNKTDDQINLSKNSQIDHLKIFGSIIKNIFSAVFSSGSFIYEIDTAKSCEYQDYQITQIQQNYELREKHIEDLLIARNLPGLFEKLLELKGFQINQNYTLRWLYAVGGQSIVYLAEKPNKGLVIVKIPYLDYHRPAYISQEQINKSRICLIKEAELIRKFNYTNLPYFYDFVYSKNPLYPDYCSTGNAKEEPYLVMEFIQGMDLLEVTRYLHNQSPVRYEELESLAWETASKMTDFCIHLSQKGYLYSDINPLNLIFTSTDNRVRILDAGSLIPLQFDPNILPPFTESYIPVDYFEAYEQGKIIYPNPNYVMYALGKMLWETLTNKQPYPGENPNIHEPTLQNYSSDLKRLIYNLLEGKYTNFDNLKSDINSILASI